MEVEVSGTLPVEYLIQPYDVFCRLCLGTIFGLAVAGKLRSAGWLAHKQTIWRAVAPLRNFVAPIATVSISAEIFCIFLLFIPAPGIFSYIFPLLLLFGFSSFTLIKIMRRDTEPCRCFGAGDQTTPGNALSRNLLAIMVGASGLLAAASGREAADLAWTLSFGVAGTCAGILLVALPRLNSTRSRRITQ